ncbi:hypothetical protein BH09PLA1_BH09PLA1_18270 [soil metagenome]
MSPSDDGRPKCTTPSAMAEIPPPKGEISAIVSYGNPHEPSFELGYPHPR